MIGGGIEDVPARGPGPPAVLLKLHTLWVAYTEGEGGRVGACVLDQDHRQHHVAISRLDAEFRSIRSADMVEILNFLDGHPRAPEVLAHAKRTTSPRVEIVGADR